MQIRGEYHISTQLNMNKQITDFEITIFVTPGAPFVVGYVPPRGGGGRHSWWGPKNFNFLIQGKC